MSAEYDKYLLEHISNVKQCYELLWNATLEEHDASKYSEEEYSAYDAHFYDVGEATEEDYTRAWLHHIHSNPHHWQHWVIIEDEGTITPVRMTEDAFKEMIADWASFSLASGDPHKIIDWYTANRETILMDDYTKNLTDKAVVYAYWKLKDFLEGNSTALME